MCSHRFSCMLTLVEYKVAWLHSTYADNAGSAVTNPILNIKSKRSTVQRPVSPHPAENAPYPSLTLTCSMQILEQAPMNANPDQQPSGSCMDSKRNLLDLPLAWLLRVLKRLDRASRLTLFRTCKTLKDLVLDSADSTCLTLQPLELKQEQMLKALELLHQHSKQVAVCFHSKQRVVKQVLPPTARLFLGPSSQRKKEAHNPNGSQLAEHSCSLLTQAQLMGYLDRVTSLKFIGAVIAMPLKPVFSDACPNLTALCLRDSRIIWQEVTTDSLGAGFPKLQQLRLHNVTGAYSQGTSLKLRPLEYVHQACKHLEQRLAQFTGLKSLQLLEGGPFTNTFRVPLYQDITAALSTFDQLTHFEVPWHSVPDRFEWNQVKSLQSLQLHGCLLGDKLMQQLLALPNLTLLAVQRVAITQSYRGHDCCWQQLVIGTMDMQHLAYLPLHSKLHIKSKPDGAIVLRLHKETASAHIQEALDNIITSKWRGWQGARVTYSGNSDQGVVFGQTLPLCNGAGHLTLDCATLTSTDMAALEAFVVSQQQGLVLSLSWPQAVTNTAELIGHMPAGSSLVLSRIDEATVIHLCSAAQRSFALHVKQMQDLQPGAGKRVIAALLKRGCRRVKVVEPHQDWIVIVGFGNVVPQRDSRSWATALFKAT